MTGGQMLSSGIHFDIRYAYSFGVRTLFIADIFELKIPPIGNTICL